MKTRGYRCRGSNYSINVFISNREVESTTKRLLVYTGLICSITGAESILNNLCDRELLVGGTIIQEAIDKTSRSI